MSLSRGRYRSRAVAQLAQRHAPASAYHVPRRAAVLIADPRGDRDRHRLVEVFPDPALKRRHHRVTLGQHGRDHEAHLGLAVADQQVASHRLGQGRTLGLHDRQRQVDVRERGPAVVTPSDRHRVRLSSNREAAARALRRAASWQCQAPPALLEAGVLEVGLYLPTKIFVYEGADNLTHVSYDKFAPVMARYGKPELNKVATVIDGVLAGLGAHHARHQHRGAHTDPGD